MDVYLKLTFSTASAVESNVCSSSVRSEEADDFPLAELELVKLCAATARA